jgi:hypothetical protein
MISYSYVASDRAREAAERRTTESTVAASPR